MNKPWKEVTIYDIAKELGISASTVSRALNDNHTTKEKTKELVRTTAARMRYIFHDLQKPANTNQTKTVGVIIPFFDRDNMAEVLTGILDMAGQLDLKVIVNQSSGQFVKEIEAIRQLFQARVDGLLVCLSHEKAAFYHFEKFHKYKIPVAAFHRVWNNPLISQVQINNFQAAFDVTAHLIEQGCRTIVHITHRCLNNIYKDRLEGYKAALSFHDIPFNEQLVITSDLAVGSGKKAAGQIMDLPARPDGLLVDGNQCAIECMKYLQLAGLRIPLDMAVAAFNNEPIADLYQPGLTTVDMHGYQMGQLALSQMANLITGKKGRQETTPLRTLIQHGLVIRTSSQRRSLTQMNKAYRQSLTG